MAHPGAFCSPTGTTGTTNAGTDMICSVTTPGSRARWRRNGPAPAKKGRGKRATKTATTSAPLPLYDAGITLDTAPVPPPADDAGIRAAIEDAYGKALDAKGPDATNRYVGLKKLRQHLNPNIPRADVDRVLDKMIEDPNIRLQGELNQAALDDADRAAAVQIGGQARDLMAIGDPWARPAPAPLGDRTPAAVAGRLQDLTKRVQQSPNHGVTDAEISALLADLSVPELKQVAAATGMPATHQQRTREALTSYIRLNTVDNALNFRAILDT